ncbi:hypothetical protein [Microbispora sp. KK1-11]|uniref:hypothetical protein n=1 Tax=Microbispora sp. KK1-11 TaxID=2053005 RepID=UPI0011574CF3|nr:hypothetical protein [Microbispora sp. KK1-11]TQS29114.1 hypothetical protein FLW16_12270 [Microbispora sp. KK1-11]
MHALWQDEVRSVANRYRLALSVAKKFGEEAAQLADWASDADEDGAPWDQWATVKAAQASEAWARATKQFKTEMNEIRSWRDHPAVWIRSYQQSSLKAYHLRDDCGWIGDERGRKQVLLGRAIKEGLHVCKACREMAGSASLLAAAGCS